MTTADIDDIDYDQDGRAVLGEEHYTGEVVEHDARGTLIFSARYRDGWQEGPERHFFPDGQLEAEGEWVYGRRIGRHRSWHSNGQLAEEIAYDDLGNGVRAGRWRPDGTPLP